MFEPIHGSAFDITGKGVANPVASFWTSAEMLAWLGEEDASTKLLDAVERVCEKGIVTADLGGSAKTAEVTEAVVQEIKTSYGIGPRPHSIHHERLMKRPADKMATWKNMSMLFNKTEIPLKSPRCQPGRNSRSREHGEGRTARFDRPGPCRSQDSEA